MDYSNDGKNDMQVEFIKTVERSKSNTHRLDRVQETLNNFQAETREEIHKIHEEYKVLYELTSSIKTLSQVVSSTNEKVDSIKEQQELMNQKITDLENAPGKEALKFEKSLKEKIITSIVIAIIGFAIGVFFPFLSSYL